MKVKFITEKVHRIIFFFLIGKKQQDYDFDSRRKLIMINSVLLMGILFIITFAFICFLENFITLVIIDFSVALTLIALYLYIRFTGQYIKGAFLITFIVFLFFTGLFITGAARQQAFVWFYAFPLITLFLLGRKWGTILSVILILCPVLIHSVNSFITVPYYEPYSSQFILRFFLSYLFVCFLTYLYEWSRLKLQKRLESAMIDLNEQAISDGLTGLYNRHYMDQILKKVIGHVRRTGQTIALLMIDLDYFKDYNDTYGHVKGDEVLIAFSEVLLSHIRRKTDYVFRYGGEEFLMLLSPTNTETARKFAGGIIETLDKLSIPHKKSPYGHVTTSIGIAVTDQEKPEILDTLIKIADEALYKAKKEGRNRYCINTDDSSIKSAGTPDSAETV